MFNCLTPYLHGGGDLPLSEKSLLISIDSVDFTSDMSILNREPISSGTLTSNEEHTIQESLADLSPNGWTPCQPNLHLSYKLIAQGPFGALSSHQ